MTFLICLLAGLIVIVTDVFVAAGFSLRDERETLKYTQAEACGY